MKIDFYGHTLELNDEILEKHGKFAGYAFAKSDNEYKTALLIEIEATITRLFHIPPKDYSIKLFNNRSDKELCSIIENDFLQELEIMGIK